MQDEKSQTSYKCSSSKALCVQPLVCPISAAQCQCPDAKPQNHSPQYITGEVHIKVQP